MAIIPDKTTKLYYSIKEVGEMFGLNDSTLRYWEKEFPFLKPKVAGNKVRQYAIKSVQKIEVKEEGKTKKVHIPKEMRIDSFNPTNGKKTGITYMEFDKPAN